MIVVLLKLIKIYHLITNLTKFNLFVQNVGDLTALAINFYFIRQLKYFLLRVEAAIR